MAAQINDFVAPVTAETHKFTHECNFTGEEFPGLITKAGFRNLLESHIRSLSRTKQISYTRNKEWLDAIRHGSDIPPSGYAGNQASWRNEIGATNRNTSKWIVEGERVYKKTGAAKESGAMTPTENLYELMTCVHKQYGHKGRDVYYKLVQTYSGSVKKAFCAQFVQVCCEEAERWEEGGNVKYDFKPEVRHRAARGNELAAAAPMAADAPMAAVAPMMALAENVGDIPIVDRQIIDESESTLESLLEEMLMSENNNFGPEGADSPLRPEPRNAENAVLDPQLFAMDLNYGHNNTGVSQQSPPAQDVQVHDAQEMDLDRYEFDQYNFDQYSFPGQVQQIYFPPDNNMIVDQNIVVGNMEIGLETPIMFENYGADSAPAASQSLQIPAETQAIQPARYIPQVPSYGMEFSSMDDNGPYAFNMMDAEDPEVSTSRIHASRQSLDAFRVPF